MRVVDPLRKPDFTATPRAGLPPFLPTLGLAVVAALLSFACREPSRPVPEPAGMHIAQVLPAMAVPDRTPFNPGPLFVAELDPVPASEAFARLAPLIAASEPAALPARAARHPAIARSERRRAPASRMATTQPPVAARPTPGPVAPPEALAAQVETEDGRFLPEGALPFAAVDAAWDAARSAGTGAARLGSSVVSLVTELR